MERLDYQKQSQLEPIVINFPKEVVSVSISKLIEINIDENSNKVINTIIMVSFIFTFLPFSFCSSLCNFSSCYLLPFVLIHVDTILAIY